MYKRQVYKVEDSEPFRFGPGKRVWSEFALIIPVLWSGVWVLLRVSVIAHKIPMLLSKYVFKRLGGVIDLDDNQVTFKRFPEKLEPLRDLPSGHTAIKIIKPEITSVPDLDKAAYDICQKGEEVTVNDEKIRATLKPCETSHGVHTVGWDEANDSDSMPQMEESSENGRAGEPSETETESESDVDNYLQQVAQRARMRAAPFYKDGLPGWRARAKSILSSVPPLVSALSLIHI